MATSSVKSFKSTTEGLYQIMDISSSLCWDTGVIFSGAQAQLLPCNSKFPSQVFQYLKNTKNNYYIFRTSNSLCLELASDFIIAVRITFLGRDFKCSFFFFKS
jgi:hypothetical protein